MKHPPIVILCAILCLATASRADEVWLQPDGALSNDTHTRVLDPNNPRNLNNRDYHLIMNKREVCSRGSSARFRRGDG